jgi:prophage regulatory protein
MDSPVRPLTTSGDSATPALLLRISSVVRVTGLGRSTIYRMMATDDFPSPVRLTNRVVAWRRTDLEKWSDTRQPAEH